MGITVMIVMGLLSMLAISTIDFDGLDELRSRLEEAQEEQEEEEIQDTSELGWLDVDDQDTRSDVLDNDLFSFLGSEPVDTDQEVGAALAPLADDEADEFDSFDTTDDEDSTGFDAGLKPDVANDLWPLEAQSQDEEADAEDEDVAEDEDMIELAGFNANEDALELPYSQKEDDAGNPIPAEVTVSHHDGWTEVGIDGETHSFSHTQDTDFQGLEPEDVLLRAA